MNWATLRSESRFTADLGPLLDIQAQWEREEVIEDGDYFYDELARGIEEAREEIAFESYIFASDECGRRFAGLLAAAARRGVKVRVMVDGIGSVGWAKVFGAEMSEAGVEWKVYHELPWARFFHATPARRARSAKFFHLFRRINQRNHRKLCVIDRKTAYLGSRNITDVHSMKLSGREYWRDTSAIVEGEGVKDFLVAFERAWKGRRWRRKNRLLRDERSGAAFSPLVRLNLTFRMRMRNYRLLRMKILRARERIWITNAYFVPHQSLLDALLRAAKNGADVRIILPSRSDVFFIPWVARSIQQTLLESGARVYEYLPTVLHAKTIVIDSFGLVGSSNLNHRSLVHDLEVDVVVTSNGRDALAQQFTKDLESSREVLAHDWKYRPLWMRVLGRVVLLFRYWI